MQRGMCSGRSLLTDARTLRYDLKTKDGGGCPWMFQLHDPDANVEAPMGATSSALRANLRPIRRLHTLSPYLASGGQDCAVGVLLLWLFGERLRARDVDGLGPAMLPKVEIRLFRGMAFSEEQVPLPPCVQKLPGKFQMAVRDVPQCFFHEPDVPA